MVAEAIQKLLDSNFALMWGPGCAVVEDGIHWMDAEGRKPNVAASFIEVTVTNWTEKIRDLIDSEPFRWQSAGRRDRRRGQQIL